MTKFVVHSFAKKLASRLITNEDLSSKMETSDEWIKQRTGIEQRYWVAEGETTSSLAIDAARITLGKEQPDCIIAATLSPDYNFPGIGVQIQAGLDLPAVPAYDLRNQCCGFLYALQMAKALAETDVYQKILLVGAEVHSTGLDVSTRGRDIAVLFGDGAGSCILEKYNESLRAEICFELITTELHSDGRSASELWCEHPGSAQFPQRLTAKMIEEGLCYPRMNGRKVFETAVKSMVEVSSKVLKKCGVSPAEIKHFIPHQANKRINSSVAEFLHVPAEAVFSTIEKYGNTTAATIPIGFTDALQQRKFESGDLVLSTAFGSGFVWGASVFRVV